MRPPGASESERRRIGRDAGGFALRRRDELGYLQQGDIKYPRRDDRRFSTEHGDPEILPCMRARLAVGSKSTVDIQLQHIPRLTENCTYVSRIKCRGATDFGGGRLNRILRTGETAGCFPRNGSSLEAVWRALMIISARDGRNGSRLACRQIFTGVNNPRRSRKTLVNVLCLMLLMPKQDCCSTFCAPNATSISLTLRQEYDSPREDTQLGQDVTEPTRAEIRPGITHYQLSYLVYI